MKSSEWKLILQILLEVPPFPSSKHTPQSLTVEKGPLLQFIKARELSERYACIQLLGEKQNSMTYIYKRSNQIITII